jgi:hypothetical protein
MNRKQLAAMHMKRLGTYSYDRYGESLRKAAESRPKTIFWSLPDFSGISTVPQPYRQLINDESGYYDLIDKRDAKIGTQPVIIGRFHGKRGEALMKHPIGHAIGIKDKSGTFNFIRVPSQEIENFIGTLSKEGQAADKKMGISTSPKHLRELLNISKEDIAEVLKHPRVPDYIKRRAVESL